MTVDQNHLMIADIPARIRHQIYTHVFAHATHEVGGVIVGRLDGRTGRPRVTGAIEALEAVGEAASVTFTHEAWETILEQQEEEFPNTQIVGWYHSHPGFGIFLSEHDLFIHRNFFGDAHQFAYVVDPHAYTEGVFGWRDGDIEMFEERDVQGFAGSAATSGGDDAAAAAGASGKLTVELADLDDLPADPAPGGNLPIDVDATPAPRRAIVTDGDTRAPRMVRAGADARARPSQLPPAKSRRIPLIAGAVVALAVIGGSAAMLTSGGGGFAAPGAPGAGFTAAQRGAAVAKLRGDGKAALTALEVAKRATAPTPTPVAVVEQPPVAQPPVVHHPDPPAVPDPGLSSDDVK